MCNYEHGVSLDPRGECRCLNIEESGNGVGVGRVGIGTWATQAEFDDIKVTRRGKALFEESFASGAETRWSSADGDFAIHDGVYAQAGGAAGAVSLFLASVEANVITYSLRARKTGGPEGFLILFGQKDSQRFYWWNIGGGGNSRHAIEKGGGSYTGGKVNVAD